MMATFGVGGVGKTTWLESLMCNSARVLKMLPKKFASVVFLFAGFNNTTTWKAETDSNIESSTCARMALSYKKQENSLRNVLALLSCPECTDFDAFINWIREEELKVGNRSKIAVFLLIDEVLKISSRERTTLLDALNTFQQAELQRGNATFVIVSSLMLAPIADVVISESKRKLHAIRLTNLSEKSRETVINKILAYRKSAYRANDDDSAFSNIVEVSVAQTAGHLRTLANLYVEIEQNIRKQCPLIMSSVVCITTRDQLTSITEILRRILNGESLTFVETDPITFGPLVGCALQELAKWHFVSIQPHNEKFQEVDVTLHPMCLRELDLRVYKGSRLYRLAYLIQKIFAGLHQPWKTVSMKQWEQAMPCIEELRACLMFSAGKNTLHTSVVPNARVMLWKGHTNVRVNPKVVATTKLDETSYNNPQMITKPLRSEALIVASSPTQEAVEGYQNLYEAVMQNGSCVSVPTFFQMKMYKKVTPKGVGTWVNKMHTFATTTMGLKKGNYYVVLYCGAKNFNKDYKTWEIPAGTILIPLNSIRDMLTVFGQTCLEKHFDELEVLKKSGAENSDEEDESGEDSDEVEEEDD
jgi:hypothetical protein